MVGHVFKTAVNTDPTRAGAISPAQPDRRIKMKDKRTAELKVLTRELSRLGLLTEGMTDAQIQQLFTETVSVINPLITLSLKTMSNDLKNQAWDEVFPSDGKIPADKTEHYWDKFTSKMGEIVVTIVLGKHPEGAPYKSLILPKVIDSIRQHPAMIVLHNRLIADALSAVTSA
jgi:hypothetical protein